MTTRKNTVPPFSFSAIVLSCIFFLTVSSLFVSPSIVVAETRFVKPSSEVVVRRGQGTDYKIVAMVKDGTSVEFIEESGDYAKVRLANGKEGWMLKRFLSKDPPLHEIVAALRAEKEQIMHREKQALQKLEEMSSTLTRTERELDSVLLERDQAQSDFQNLKKDTADVVQIKKDLLKTTKDNELLIQELALIEQENNSLKKDNAIKWFLAGGGVLLIGMLLGMMSSQSRKRKSSLL